MEHLQERLRAFRDARDWQQFHTSKNLAISLAIESAELLELFQWTEECPRTDEGCARQVVEEVADIFIYLLYFCDRNDIDLTAVTIAKIEANEARYPIATSRGVAGNRASKASE